MEQNQVQKTAKHILKIALIFQIIYVVNIALVIIFPKPFLILRGHSGNYDFPFNSIYFGNAVICTILFIILYLVLNAQINQQKKLGIGTGILLGVFTYITYFIMDEISSFLNSIQLDKLVNEAETNNTFTVMIGENVAGTSIIDNWCSLAKVWFFTAIVLMFIAYGIYSFYCKNELEHRKSNF